MKKKIVMIVLFISVLIVCFITFGKKEENIKTEVLYLDEHLQEKSEFEKDVHEAFELLKDNGNKSQDIWPDYDLSKNAIVVCQRDDQTNRVIHAWKITTNEIKVLTNSDLSHIEVPAAGSYNGVEFENTDSIIIALNNEVLPALQKVAISNYIYEIGTHEMVHFHYEAPFRLLKLSLEQKMHGGRGTEFPNAALPRVYRKMIYDKLVMAFENPLDEKLYLGQAKYWYEKWEDEYSKEYYQIKTTDYMEGKARYIQYMLCMPSNLSQQEKALWISDHFDKTNEPSKSMDNESYKLGFVAGVLLDRQGNDWKDKLTRKTQTPVEYLLKDVQLIQDESHDFEEKLEISKKQVDKVNRDIESKIANITNANNDVYIPFLEMSDKYMVGSFETSGFIKYMGENITVEFGGTFENDNGVIQISHLSVYERNKFMKDTYILPLTMDYKIEKDHLIIENQDVSCDIKVKQSKDKDGRIIYSMQ